MHNLAGRGVVSLCVYQDIYAVKENLKMLNWAQPESDTGVPGGLGELRTACQSRAGFTILLQVLCEIELRLDKI